MNSFLKEFIKNPRTTGAIAPSSKYLAEKMLSNIDFENSRCIVEYGPGTGVFTEKLIARKKDETLLIIVERNIKFYCELLKLYGNKKSVKIVHDGAENIKNHLKFYSVDKVDYVVSGLPFTALPEKMSQSILESTRDVLSDNGEFITFQYSKIKKDMITGYFKNINLKRVRLNIPPAYVISCRVSGI